MKLTKEEARWLDDKWNDFYYYFQVEDMFEKDQEIFKNIGMVTNDISPQIEVIVIDNATFPFTSLVA